MALQCMEATQAQCKAYHDSFIKHKEFKEGDLVLAYDSRFGKFPGKLQQRWMGPYKVLAVNPNGSVQVQTVDTSDDHFLINGYRLKKYFPPWGS